MDKTKVNWDMIFEKAGSTPPKTDDWLDKYMPLIKKSCDVPIIDLGCGFGNDTLYLTRKGFSVISCDYSKAALERLKHFVENPDCRCIDMREKLPFKSDSAFIIICDLSLHYFNDKTTKAVISEIRRVLKPQGTLLCRVNSVNEIRNEANQMTELEKNFYLVDQKEKRYFGKEDVLSFFETFKISNIISYDMKRYPKLKSVLEFAAQKNKS